MKFKDLTEITLSQWTGEPFEAHAVDDDSLDFPQTKTTFKIVGWKRDYWIEEHGLLWKHVYPVDWNKQKPKRMTKRQLAKWLAQGNGEQCTDNGTGAYQTHGYNKQDADEEVFDNVRVRTWDSEEWVEPTVDLIKEN